ncbi:hypothetical protein GVAV_002177 [Gurleya vavrai]
MKIKNHIFAYVFCVLLENCEFLASEVNNKSSMLPEKTIQAQIIETSKNDENNGETKQYDLTEDNNKIIKNNSESSNLNQSSLFEKNYSLLEHASSDSISNIELDFIAFKQSDIESRKLLKDLIIKILEIENTKPKKNQILEDIKKLIVDLESEKIDLQKKLEESISFCNSMGKKVTKTKLNIDDCNIDMQKILKEYEEKIKTCQKIENEIKNTKDKLKLVNLNCCSLYPVKFELNSLINIYKHNQDNCLRHIKDQEKFEKKIKKKQTTIELIKKKLIECNDFLVACKGGMFSCGDDKEKLQKLFDQFFVKNIEIRFTNLFDQKANNIYLIFHLSKNILEKQSKYYSLIEKKNDLRGSNFQQKDYHIIDKNNSITKATYNCHEKNLNYVKKMRIILEEIKPMYDEIDDLKTEIKEIEILLQKNLSKLKNTDLKNFFHRHDQVILDKNKTQKVTNPNCNSKDDLKNQLISDDIKIINEFLEFKINEEPDYKSYFEIQAQQETIYYTKPYIIYINNVLKGIDKAKQKLFYEMCHSELIFYIDQITINNENSINKNNLNEEYDLELSLKNLEKSISDSDVKYNNNKNQKEEKKVDIIQNDSGKKFSSKNETNDVNIISRHSQDEKKDPFYTKIWFITTVFICVAIIISILVYYFKK